MAYACDICLSVCSAPDLADLSGWWGRKEMYPATARKVASCRRVPLETEASVEGHICRCCVEATLAKNIRLNAEKSREVLRAERRQAFPKESAFTNLRKSIPWTAEVLCDGCEESCFERHVELHSVWVDEEQAHQVAHLCGCCYESYLLPLLAAKAGARSAIASTASCD